MSRTIRKRINLNLRLMEMEILFLFERNKNKSSEGSFDRDFRVTNDDKGTDRASWCIVDALK